MRNGSITSTVSGSSSSTTPHKVSSREGSSRWPYAVSPSLSRQQNEVGSGAAKVGKATPGSFVNGLCRNLHSRNDRDLFPSRHHAPADWAPFSSPAAMR